MHLAPVLRPVLILALLSAAGCSMTAPPYSAHVSNTVALREAGFEKVSVGEFRKDPAARKNVDKVMARASPVQSPYGSYTAYMREALAAEFDHADLLDPKSNIRIEGVLLKNELGGNLEREYAEIEMDLKVTRDGATVYQAKKLTRYDWESTFLGAVAIPRAVANYQVGVQRLIAAYIADPAFIAALKKR